VAQQLGEQQQLRPLTLTDSPAERPVLTCLVLGLQAPPGYPCVLYAPGTGPLPAVPSPGLDPGSGVDLHRAAQRHVGTKPHPALDAQQMAAPQQPHLAHEAAQGAAGLHASDTGSDRVLARHSSRHHHHGSEHQQQLSSAAVPLGSAAGQDAGAAGEAATAAETVAAGPGSKQGNRRSQLDTMSQVLLSEGSGEGPSGDLRPTAQSSMTTSTGGSTGAGHTHSRAGGGSSSCLAAPSQPSSLGAAPWDAGEALLARLVAERGSNAVQALAQLGCAHPTPAAEAGARAAAAAAAVSAQLSADGSGEALSGGSEGGAGPRGSWGTGRPSASAASRGSMGPPLPRAPPLTLPPAKAPHTVSSHSPAAAAYAAALAAGPPPHHSGLTHGPSTPRLVPVGPGAMRARLGEPTFTLVRSLLVAQQEAFLGQLYDLHRAATRQRRLAAELAATPAPTSAAVLAQAAIARLRAAPSSSRGTSSKKHSGSVAAPGSSGHLAGSQPPSGHRAAGWRTPAAATAAAAAAAAGGGHAGLPGVPLGAQLPVLPPAGPLPLHQDDGGAALAAAHLGHHVLLMAQLPAGLRAGVVLPPGDPGPDWVGVAIRRSTPGITRPTPARYVLRTAAGPATSAEPTVQVPSNSLSHGGGASVGGGAMGSGAAAAAAAAAEPGVVVDTAASHRRQGASPAAAVKTDTCTAVPGTQQQQGTPSQHPAGALEGMPAAAAAAGAAVIPAPVRLPPAGEAGVSRPQVRSTPSPSGAEGGSRHADLQTCSRPLSWLDGAARGHPSASLPQESPLQQQQHEHHEQQQLPPGVGCMLPPRSPLPASLAALGAALLPGGAAGGLVLGLGEGPPPLNVFRPTPQFPPAEATRFLAGPVVNAPGFDPHSYWMRKHYGGSGPTLSTPAPATAPGTSGGLAGGEGPGEVVSAPLGGAGQEGGRSASASQGGPGPGPLCWWKDPAATFGELGCVDPTAPIPVASQLEAGGAGCTSSLAGPPPGAPPR
jgi:hypothetical protein